MSFALLLSILFKLRQKFKDLTKGIDTGPEAEEAPM
jgi:hypothetical protein